MFKRIESNDLDFIADIGKHIIKAQEASIQSVLNISKSILYNFIASDGDGAFPGYSQISTFFSGKSGRWYLRSRRPLNYLWLYGFVSSEESKDSGKLLFGIPKKTSLLGARDSFAKVTQGNTIQVTEKMRKKMGAMREAYPPGQRKFLKPGKDIFPLRSDTNEITIQKRDFNQIMNRIENDIPKLFESNFEKFFFDMIGE